MDKPKVKWGNDQILPFNRRNAPAEVGETLKLPLNTRPIINNKEKLRRVPTYTDDINLGFNPQRKVEGNDPEVPYHIRYVNPRMNKNKALAEGQQRAKEYEQGPISSTIVSSPTSTRSALKGTRKAKSANSSDTSIQSIAPSQSVASNVSDMLYVTYQNKTYPVHVEPSTQQLQKVNGGTHKHNTNKRKTRKH